MVGAVVMHCRWLGVSAPRQVPLPAVHIVLQTLIQLCAQVVLDRMQCCCQHRMCLAPCRRSPLRRLRWPRR